MPRQKATPSKHANNALAQNKQTETITQTETLQLLGKDVRVKEEDEESGITSASSGSRSICGTMTPNTIDGGDEGLHDSSMEDSFDSSAEQNLGFSPSRLEDKVTRWLTERFVISKGLCSTVQDIINLYRSEFPKDFLYAPLQSYQVGTLIRRYFPTIGRSKISVAGRRVWVYKDLGARVGQRASSGSDSAVADNPTPPIAETPIVPNAQLAGSGHFEEHRAPIDDSWSSNSFRKTKIMDSGLPTMLSYMDQTGEDASKTTSNDYDNYAHVSAVTLQAKRRKTLGVNSHTIDNNVVTWIKNNYESAEGSYVKALEMLAHYNTNHPRKPLQNLSQVGRLLRSSITQECKHLRRYFKDSGGKREWVYTNIQVKEDCIENFEAAVRGDWYAARRKSPNRESFDDAKELPQYTLTLGSSNSQKLVTPDVSPESIDGSVHDISEVTPPIVEQNTKTEPSEEDASAGKGTNSSSEFPQSATQRAEQAGQNDSIEQDRDTGSINGDNSGEQRDIPRSAFERMPPNQGGLSRNLTVLKETQAEGWLLTHCSKNYCEWIRLVDDYLIDQRRIVIEVRIQSDWDITVNANGRKVYPDSLELTHVERSPAAVTEFLKTVAGINFCRGFPAPYFRKLEIQGHIVSYPEIWSVRSCPDNEEIRHRSVHCNLLNRSEGVFCQACFHGCRMHMQRIKTPPIED